MMQKKDSPKFERGQAIVLIAMALVGLIAMIGIMMDGAKMFIDSSRLKRAVDSAAVSAALQYREGYTDTELEEAATEFLQLNLGEDVYDVIVEVCNPNSTHHDDSLCTTPRRKLARVTATKTVTFGFLSVLGIDSTTITTNAISEAASVDVVIVIDSSASMAFEGGGSPDRGDDPADDPSNCNERVIAGNPNPDYPCQPFGQVKDAAAAFVGNLYFPYDRVAIVTFDTATNHSPAAPWVTVPTTPAISYADRLRAKALAEIDDLKVFQPDPCDTASGPCLNYDSGTGAFIGLECPLFRNTNPMDPTSCGSSNIGGGFVVAGNTFAQTPVREESLWVVIILAGGPANRTLPTNSRPYGYCPPSTWIRSPMGPFCRDSSADTRHCADVDTRDDCEEAGGVWDPQNYDADDYARDMADFVTNPVTGQNAVIYSIGLGDLMTNAPTGDADAGERLLMYASEDAGGTTANHGIYYAAPTVADLHVIFRKIAENIATRLTH